MVIVLDRFFLRDLLSARTIIRYVLQRVIDEFDRIYLWEILFNALSGLDDRASKVCFRGWRRGRELRGLV